jgi:hypothetical protein
VQLLTDFEKHCLETAIHLMIIFKIQINPQFHSDNPEANIFEPEFEAILKFQVQIFDLKL